LLIVEDDASLRVGLTASLVTHGFDVRAEATDVASRRT
jgi:DNA-binding response OmpR family regulator